MCAAHVSQEGCGLRSLVQLPITCVRQTVSCAKRNHRKTCTNIFPVVRCGMPSRANNNHLGEPHRQQRLRPPPVLTCARVYTCMCVCVCVCISGSLRINLQRLRREEQTQRTALRSEPQHYERRPEKCCACGRCGHHFNRRNHLLTPLHCHTSHSTYSTHSTHS